MSAPDPARAAAYEVLRRTFEHGAFADRAFPAAAARHGLEGPARARGQWLALGAVAARGRSDELVRRLSGRDPARLDRPVAAALRLGAFELLAAERPADHAAVGDAVELAKRGMGRGGPARARAAAGFVNAVLRRVAREREELLGALHDRDPAAAALCHSVPEWIARLWWEELGEGPARSLLASLGAPPPVALRANPLRAATAELAGRLEPEGAVPAAEAGYEPPLAPAEALVLRAGLGPVALEALERGDAIAQSLAAQAAVELLDPAPGERVLDLCAAPGHKSAAIAARVGEGGELVAIEGDAGRASALRETCERAGAPWVRVVHADAREGVGGEGYDRVLVDPPCSDLGTLASRPDARWRKEPGDVPRLAALQRELLAAGARSLRPGGTLVYSTCTISRAEGEGLVAAALADDPRLEPDDLGLAHPGLASSHDGRFLQTRPDRDRTDGFFIARLRRRGDG